MTWSPPYASVDELVSYLGEGDSHPDELALAIETASRSVDRLCNRQFGLVDAPQARLYTANYDVIDSALTRRRRWVIEIDDLMTVEGLTVETETGANGAFIEIPSGDYLPHPVNAVLGGRPWTKLVVSPGAAVVPDGTENGVKVTASFGWSAVPDAVKLATMIQAARLFARRHAPFGIAGNPEVGQLRLLERLDVDLATSVQSFVRVWGAV